MMPVREILCLLAVGATCTAIVVASEEDGLLRFTEEQEVTMRLGLCPGFTYEACDRARTIADEALMPCHTNDECGAQQGPDAVCCPSKCAGMRCVTATYARRAAASHRDGKASCPPVVIRDLLKSCDNLNYNCTVNCHCCPDVATCSNRCID